MSEASEKLNAEIVAAGLTVTSVFVPFSRSRNASEKHPSLNWKVTLLRNGIPVVMTDYMAGSGHCPTYKKPVTFLGKPKIDQWATRNAIARECETGRQYRAHDFHNRAPAILPDTCDVIHSLILDCDVLELSGFEDWANNYGYETDSRKAESIYRACLEIALKVRASLGDATLTALREAGQDY